MSVAKVQSVSVVCYSLDGEITMRSFSIFADLCTMVSRPENASAAWYLNPFGIEYRNRTHGGLDPTVSDDRFSLST